MDNFLAQLSFKLKKTKASLVNRIAGLLTGRPGLDKDLFAEMEEILIEADIGVKTSLELVESIRKKTQTGEIHSGKEVIEELKKQIKKSLTPVKSEPPGIANLPTVILLVGVNGVGKTTTIAKLAYKFKGEGKRILLAAADTFRAAAIDQLNTWAQQLDIDIISHRPGSDPTAVVFDALEALQARSLDVLIVDTAGRLHTKTNLMAELEKMQRIIMREYPEAVLEILLVLDATTGQNALVQAQVFQKALNLTGIILTKLDGTAKGGIIVPISQELGVPVKYIGVGEDIGDLHEFSPPAFVTALFANADT